jgi:hypothetical protein
MASQFGMASLDANFNDANLYHGELKQGFCIIKIEVF